MMEAASHTTDKEQWVYRMKDLCDLTGLPRQAIHFYIQQGLLPPGRKTGRNMAWYTDAHVERLKLVRQLQHERFLPLKAIRALVNGQDDAFTPQQRSFLVNVKQRLSPAFPTRSGQIETLDADALLSALGLARRELDRMIQLEMIVTRTDEGGRTLIAKDDAWMLEFLADLRRIGLTPELGFDVGEIAFYEEAVSKLFDREIKFLNERLGQLPPDQVASIIELAIPIVHSFLVRYHEAKIRDFVAAL